MWCSQLRLARDDLQEKKKPGAIHPGLQEGGMKRYNNCPASVAVGGGLGLVHILEEERKGDEKRAADNIFNPLDVGIEIHQGLIFADYSHCHQILAHQFANLPAGF
jgi:hypothetical protein